MTIAPGDPHRPPPPGSRGGCLPTLMIGLGILMLLPGLCGIILVGLDPHELTVDRSWLFGVLGMIAIGVGGVALIWVAVRQAH